MATWIILYEKNAQQEAAVIKNVESGLLGAHITLTQDESETPILVKFVLGIDPAYLDENDPKSKEQVQVLDQKVNPISLPEF